MTPDTRTVEAKTIRITHDGVEWAYGLGQIHRASYKGYVGARADKICPFREGTPHRIGWYAGYRGKAIPLSLAY